MSHEKRSHGWVLWVVTGIITALVMHGIVSCEKSHGHGQRPVPVHSFMGEHPGLGHGGN